MEDFYDSIGGLVGYQAQCLELIGQQQAEGARACAASSGDSLSLSSSEDWPPGMLAAATAGGPSGDAGRSAAGPPPQHQPATTTEFLVPAGLDLASPEQAGEAAAAVAAGIAALPHLAEVYPLGGAGDRLGLRCDVSGEALPTAVLQYCGRSLLENLVRDLQVRQGGEAGGQHSGGVEAGRCGAPARRRSSPLDSPSLALAPLISCLLPPAVPSRPLAARQAREYLYWQLHGQQHTTPVAIMTSPAKGNHWRVEQLFEQAAWFGRWAGAGPRRAALPAAAAARSAVPPACRLRLAGRRRQVLRTLKRPAAPTLPTCLALHPSCLAHNPPPRLHPSCVVRRGESSFRLFQQPLVPMVSAADGRWLLEQPLKVRPPPARAGAQGRSAQDGLAGPRRRGRAGGWPVGAGAWRRRHARVSTQPTCRRLPLLCVYVCVRACVCVCVRAGDDEAGRARRDLEAHD